MNEKLKKTLKTVIIIPLFAILGVIIGYYSFFAYMGYYMLSAFVEQAVGLNLNILLGLFLGIYIGIKVSRK